MGSGRIGEPFEGDAGLAGIERVRISGRERCPAAGNRGDNGVGARLGSSLKTLRRRSVRLHKHPLVGLERRLPLRKGKRSATAQAPDRIPRHAAAEINRVGSCPAEICIDRLCRTRRAAVEAGIPGMVEDDEQLPFLRVGILPGERLRDHHLRSLGPPHRRRVGVLRGRVAVDIPAVERLGVVFVAAHRRVGILILDHVGGPLGAVGGDVGLGIHARESRQRHRGHVEILEEQPPLPTTPLHRPGDIHSHAGRELRREEIVGEVCAVGDGVPRPFRKVLVEEVGRDGGEVVVDPSSGIAEEARRIPAVTRDDQPRRFRLRAEEGRHPLRQEHRVVVIGAEDALKLRRREGVVGDRARPPAGGAGVVELGATAVVVELELVGIVLKLARRVGLGVGEARHRTGGGGGGGLEAPLKIDRPAAVPRRHGQQPRFVILARRIVLAVAPRQSHARGEVGERVAVQNRFWVVVGPPAVASLDLLPIRVFQRQEPVPRPGSGSREECFRGATAEEEVQPGIVVGRVGARVGKRAEDGRAIDLGGAVAAAEGERRREGDEVTDRSMGVDVEPAVHVEDQAGDVDADRQTGFPTDRGEAGVEEPAIVDAVVVVVGPVVNAIAIEIVVGRVVVMERGRGLDPEHRRPDHLRARRLLRIGLDMGEEGVGGEVVGVPRLVERGHSGMGPAIDEERRAGRWGLEGSPRPGPFDRRPERGDAEPQTIGAGWLGTKDRMARRSPLLGAQREDPTAQVGEGERRRRGLRFGTEGDGERAERAGHLGCRHGALEGWSVAVLVDEERLELERMRRAALAQARRLAAGEERIAPATEEEEGRFLEEVFGGEPRLRDAGRKLGESPGRRPRPARGDHVRDPEEHEQRQHAEHNQQQHATTVTGKCGGEKVQGFQRAYSSAPCMVTVYSVAEIASGRR